MKKILKELKRLRKHYRDEHKQTSHMYSIGVADGLDMAIDVLENKDFYE